MHLIKYVSDESDGKVPNCEIDELGLLCPAGRSLRSWLEDVSRRLGLAEGFLVLDSDDEARLDEVLALLVEGFIQANVRTEILNSTVCNQRIHSNRETVNVRATYFTIPNTKNFKGFKVGRSKNPLAFHFNSKGRWN